MSIAIGIATAGRRDVLSDTLRTIQMQSRSADEVIICPANQEDVDQEVLSTLEFGVRVITGNIGSSHQRNAIMSAASSDIVVFFDDDFVPGSDFLHEAESIFAEFPEIAVATGDVLADGILGPGLTMLDAEQYLRDACLVANREPYDVNNAYGCNMVVRMSVVRENNIKFDEALPLYAWLEDLDFSRQIAPYGRIVKAPSLRGVHLGTKKSGRAPGRRLGYSQVANPLYLARKGTMGWLSAVRHISRNIAANTIYSLRPEPWVDRRGRLLGNLIALLELFTGRLNPSRVLDIVKS